jgi:CRISPR/Cas system-associated endonuclease/helicase Cas3
LPDFILSRCNRVNIGLLTWEERRKIAKKELEEKMKFYELNQYLPLINDELARKCLVNEWGVRQTKINANKIIEQLDELDKENGGNIPKDIDLANYSWRDLNKSDGLDFNCPAIFGKKHKEDCSCFFSELIHEDHSFL